MITHPPIVDESSACAAAGIGGSPGRRRLRRRGAFMSTTALTAEQRGSRLGQLAGYLAKLAAQRRQTPTDDLLGALVAASDENDRLTEDELIQLALLLRRPVAQRRNARGRSCAAGQSTPPTATGAPTRIRTGST